MRKCHWSIFALASALLLVSIPGLVFAQAMILEAEDVPPRYDWTPDCTNWHELYPQFCNMHHQNHHEDNGDGVLSACDYIWFAGLRYHVDWVGPTYWLDCDGDGIEDVIFEPIEWWPGDPVCQEWVQVWPVYGEIFHVDQWGDNGSGEVDECDYVWVGPYLECHVLHVGLNIHTTEDPTPSDSGTWSKVKSLFFGLF